MKYIKYLGYLLKHKYYVAKACFKMGLYWRGIVHDLSKFTPSEFLAYANYFYKEKFTVDFDVVKALTTFGNFNRAWNAHQKRNKHHWQYWLLTDGDGATRPLGMPPKYAKEMICDWWGAGMAKHGKADPNELWNWYNANKHKMILCEITRDYVVRIMTELSEKNDPQS